MPPAAHDEAVNGEGSSCFDERAGQARRRRALPERLPEMQNAAPADLADTAFFGLRGQDLNLRPSGYEPDELPGCSTARHFPGSPGARRTERRDLYDGTAIEVTIKIRAGARSCLQPIFTDAPWRQRSLDSIRIPGFRSLRERRARSMLNTAQLPLEMPGPRSGRACLRISWSTLRVQVGERNCFRIFFRKVFVH